MKGEVIMKKVALGALLVLIIAIGFSVYYLLSNLDSIVKSAIETYGTEAAQTQVKVASVKIVLQDGSGAIKGLTVGNPAGFTAPQVFSLGEVSTQIDLKSLSEEVPVIEHVTVRSPQVFFELNQAGKNNLEALKQNIASGSSKGSSADKKSGSEPKLIIRKLLFTGGTINAKVVPLDKDYTLKLPSVQLNDLGGKTGATPTQIADQALKALTEKALAAVKKEGIDQYKKQLEGEVKKKLDEQKEKLGSDVQNKLKGLLGN